MSEENPIIGRFKICEGALHQVCTFSSITTILRQIDNMNDEWFAQAQIDESFAEMVPYAKSLTQCLLKIFWTSKDLSFHMKILKSALKPALCMNYPQIELLLDRYAMVVSRVGADCLKTYAWFQNYSFITAFRVGMCNTLRFHENFVETSLKYSADTRYFALAIENYITAYDIGEIQHIEDFAFTVILSNLENSHQNVHRLLLELFKRMMKFYSKSDLEHMRTIDSILKLSWANRNKYQLLAIIITVDSDILFKHQEFHAGRFHEGIQVGLTMHNLYAPSQSLIKSIQNKEAFKEDLIKTTVDILWNGDDLLAGNLIKFWFSQYEPKLVEKIYRTMNDQELFNDIRTTSPKFYRLLVLRNTFKRNFKSSELNKHVFTFATMFEDLETRIEVFHMLVDSIHAESDHHTQLEHIIYMLYFLRHNLGAEESNFVEQHIMRRLPDVFNLLASRKFRNQESLTEIFSIIRKDIYDHGLALGSYESIAFSLKLLNVILKQYFGSTGCLLSKKTNVKENLDFGQYIKITKIWDVRSPETFKQLLKLMEDDEHSDLSELTLNILVQYFIKTSLFETITIDDEPFIEWIKAKVASSFDDPEISSNVNAKRYFVIKFECALALNNEVLELLSVADLLKTKFMVVNKNSDPVKSMEQGMHLFKLMDSINYGIRRVNPEVVNSNLIPVLNVLLKNVAFHFLNFFCDETEPPSFELIDKKLRKLLKATSVPDAEDLKPKLVLYVWYTLRSSSEMSDSLASIITETMDHESREFNQVMYTCLDINIQILSKCCHKGVLDSASDAIGKIAKMISKEYSNLSLRTVDNTRYLHSFLVTLKKEIFANKRPPNASGDIRSSRGLIVMSHKIISSRPAFLKFLMDMLLVTVPIRSFDDTNSIQFHSNVMPIQLHLLAALVKDGDLAEEMLKYLDFILLATFKAYKASVDYVEVNALLQIIGALVPKIANQKRNILNETETTVNYEPKAVSCYEFYVKFTYSFRIALFDLDFNIEKLSHTYIIILLEIFSNYEYRNAFEHWSEIEKMRDVFTGLMGHEVEKIRMLAAKCYAQWHSDTNIMAVIIDEAEDIFTTDSNLLHSTSFSIRLMIQRYESCRKSVVDFDISILNTMLRGRITGEFKKSGFPGARNFFVRHHLLDFLLFIGFSFENQVCQSLTAENNLDNLVGYKLWAERIKNLQK